MERLNQLIQHESEDVLTFAQVEEPPEGAPADQGSQEDIYGDFGEYDDAFLGIDTPQYVPAPPAEAIGEPAGSDDQAADAAPGRAPSDAPPPSAAAGSEGVSHAPAAAGDEEDDNTGGVMLGLEGTMQDFLQHREHDAPAAAAAAAAAGSGVGGIGVAPRLTRKDSSLTHPAEQPSEYAEKARQVVLVMDANNDKPWRQSGHDVSAWFNYEFNEYSFREYIYRQIEQRYQRIENRQMDMREDEPFAPPFQGHAPQLRPPPPPPPYPPPDAADGGGDYKRRRLA